MPSPRRPIPAFAIPAEQPIGELNTTPLIDVMLVLLIMFIVTIPITTHKVDIDIPQSGGVPAKPVVHRLELDAAGRAHWDDAPVARSQLPALVRAMNSEPNAELHLRADGETPYAAFDEVLAIVKRVGVERLGMVGNERFVHAAS
ncbi:MAG TPA: biopolymer transporter ExbD [Allosphingosinicella sp.]